MVELLVTILIASIIAAIGVPSYRYVTNSSRVSGEVNALLGDLQYARSEAVKEGQMVTVCPVTKAAPQTCSNTNSWQNGWIVFSDVNNDQTAVAANILHVQPAFNSAHPDTFTSDTGVMFVSFNREGFTTAFPAGLAAGGFVTFTLYTTPPISPWTRCLQVWTTGMMGTETTSDPQGNCK